MKKHFIYLVLLILLVNLVSAYDIEKFNTEIEVYNEGGAKVVHEITFDSSNIIDAVILPAYSSDSIIVTDDKGEVKFAFLENNLIIKPNKRIVDYSIRIQYLTNSLTSKSGSEWAMDYNFPAYKKLKVDNIKEAGLIISLPNTATLNSFSKDGIVFTEHNSIKIGWKLDLKNDEETKINVIYDNNPQRKRDIIRILFFVLVGVLIIISLFFCVKFSYCKITKRISKGKKDIMRTLDNREREILKLLLEAKENKIYQSQIQKQTSISKATLSRLIKKLESRDIIEVRPSGNTNLILLQEWFKKK